MSYTLSEASCRTSRQYTNSQPKLIHTEAEETSTSDKDADARNASEINVVKLGNTRAATRATRGGVR